MYARYIGMHTFCVRFVVILIPISMSETGEKGSTQTMARIRDVVEKTQPTSRNNNMQHLLRMLSIHHKLYDAHNVETLAYVVRDRFVVSCVVSAVLEYLMNVTDTDRARRWPENSANNRELLISRTLWRRLEWTRKQLGLADGVLFRLRCKLGHTSTNVMYAGGIIACVLRVAVLGN